MEANSEMWDYRVVGININLTAPPNSTQAAEKMGGSFSKEFLEKEFPQEYIKSRSTNMALQCQQVIQLYGKKGWEHYQQGQLGNTAMLYFRKKIENTISKELTNTEMGLIERLDDQQRP